MKKFYSTIILWALLTQCACLSTTPTAAKPELPVSVKRLTADVQTLASINPPRNYQNVFSLDRAADYIFKEFSQCTARVEIQRYPVNDKEYKKPTDTIEKLDFEKIAEIVKGLYVALVEI
jgi:hypothetical protein